MPTTVPEWLVKHDGALKPGVQPNMLLVLVGGAPQYKVEARPAAGTYIAAVQQSVSGRRLDDGNLKYSSADAALTGGLEQLRIALGW